MKFVFRTRPLIQWKVETQVYGVGWVKGLTQCALTTKVVNYFINKPESNAQES